MTLNNTRQPSYRNQKVFLTSSIWNPFDAPREVDVLLVGGGGGGKSVVEYGSSIFDPGGTGGAGGQVVVIKDYFFVGPVTITIGAGGDTAKAGNPTTVTPSSGGVAVGAAGGHSGAYDYYTRGHPDDRTGLNLVSGNYTTVFLPRVNGSHGSSSGGYTSYTRPQNGKVFGNRFTVTNYLQPAFTEQATPETSGYPYGAGGGAGFNTDYDPNYAPTQTFNSPYVAKGSYGSGSGYGGSLDAAPNSGGGGGGSGDVVVTYNVSLQGSPTGGKGGSGIVVFAWND